MDLRSRTESDYIATLNFSPRFETCLCKVIFFLTTGVSGSSKGLCNYSLYSEATQSLRILGSNVGLIPMSE